MKTTSFNASNWASKRGACAALAAAILSCASACGGESITVFHIDVSAPAAVYSVNELAVSVTNGSDTLTRNLALEGQGFPVSFTVTPEGREGELLVEVEALGSDGGTPVLRGLGSAIGTIVTDSRVDIDITLAPSDFVVNTTTDGFQTPTISPVQGGRHIAALPDGSFLVAFVDDCVQQGRCETWARRFAATGEPAGNGITSDANQFAVNISSENTRRPALAANSEGRALFTWDNDQAVRGAVIDAEGNRVSMADLLIVTGNSIPAQKAHSAALGNDNFIVVWREGPNNGNYRIRGRLLNRDGNPIVNPTTNNNSAFDISESVSTIDNPVVASMRMGFGMVVTWKQANNIWGRFYGSDGVALGLPVNLTGYNAGVTVDSHHVVWAGGAATVLWGASGQPIELQRGAVVMGQFDDTGALRGAHVIVDDNLLGTAPALGTPSAAVREGGSIVTVIWHNCGDEGDSNGCGVFIRDYDAISRGPLNERAAANTTIEGNQLIPAIAATDTALFAMWADGYANPALPGSIQAPDTSASAVRARVIYIE